MIDRRGRKPHLLFWQYPFGLAVGTQAAGDDVEERFAGMGHEGDAPVITALYPILPLEYCSYGALIFLRYTASIPDVYDGFVGKASAPYRPRRG